MRKLNRLRHKLPRNEAVISLNAAPSSIVSSMATGTTTPAATATNPNMKTRGQNSGTLMAHAKHQAEGQGDVGERAILSLIRLGWQQGPAALR